MNNEVATDYNAGLTGALAYLYEEFGGSPLAGFPQPEAPDGPEMTVRASVNAAGEHFTEIKAYVVNTSAWPARALTEGTFRYYFTLEPGVDPSDITTTTRYNQCGEVRGPTRYAGDVYYVTADCSDTVIAPAGQSAYRKEIQFRLTSAGAWDPSDDWSYQGIPAVPGSTPVPTERIVLFDGADEVWGQHPDGTAPGPGPEPDPEPEPEPEPEEPEEGWFCSATLAVTSSWSSGYTAEVTIRNTSITPVDGWTLSFRLPGGERIVQSWNGTATQEGDTVTVTDAGHNAALVPGSPVTFGFQASGTASPPEGWRLNGTDCA
ncbi:cellulose binding domain-containing protein [Streptomyces sp. TRM 70351]|uniref:cellulose binding domain-containing protein n=1 Tax=Streptomyces sp. TRM 70351 TaxID=3116552 RepID=UPI002E7B4FFD|nr:cellulose binding domain-containing protein [Streptomyces sp. TRM 70351]MEE1927104.1 cellulose binding domain-containing protein [Streptomyces sp. TRM 70351]